MPGPLVEVAGRAGEAKGDECREDVGWCGQEETIDFAVSPVLKVNVCALTNITDVDTYKVFTIVGKNWLKDIPEKCKFCISMKSQTL